MNFIQGASSFDQAQTKSKATYIYILAALAALTGLLFGYDTGVISGALLYLNPVFNLSTTAQEIVTSAVLIGAVAGALASGRVTDLIGRRKSIIAIALIFTFGAVMAAAAPDVGWLIA